MLTFDWNCLCMFWPEQSQLLFISAHFSKNTKTPIKNSNNLQRAFYLFIYFLHELLITFYEQFSLFSLCGLAANCFRLQWPGISPLISLLIQQTLGRWLKTKSNFNTESCWGRRFSINAGRKKTKQSTKVAKEYWNKSFQSNHLIHPMPNAMKLLL